MNIEEKVNYLMNITIRSKDNQISDFTNVLLSTPEIDDTTRDAMSLRVINYYNTILPAKVRYSANTTFIGQLNEILDDVRSGGVLDLGDKVDKTLSSVIPNCDIILYRTPRPILIISKHINLHTIDYRQAITVVDGIKHIRVYVHKGNLLLYKAKVPSDTKILDIDPIVKISNLFDNSIRLFQMPITYDMFRGMSSLKVLNLSKIGRDIILVDNPFKDLKALTELNLRDTGLEDIISECDFKNMPELELLILSHNNLVTIPTMIHNSKLQSIDLSYNKITDLSMNLPYFPNTSLCLDLSRNKLMMFPLSITRFNTCIVDLDLSYNSIATIDILSLNTLTSLTNLNLADNIIESVNLNFFTKMVSIKDVNLSNNKISRLECAQSRVFPTMDRINFANNKIEMIPHDFFIFLLSHVKIVDFANNSIKRIKLFRIFKSWPNEMFILSGNPIDVYDKIKLEYHHVFLF